MSGRNLTFAQLYRRGYAWGLKDRLLVHHPLHDRKSFVQGWTRAKAKALRDRTLSRYLNL